MFAKQNYEIKYKAYENKDIYIGGMYKNERNGLGTLYYENGDIHMGLWLNDDAHGKGMRYVKRKDKEYLGYWEYNQFIPKSVRRKRQNSTDSMQSSIENF